MWRRDLLSFDERKLIKAEQKRKSAPDGHLDKAGNRTFHATKW